MSAQEQRSPLPSSRPKRSTGGTGYRFEPTAEQRENVEICLGARLSETEIAVALGVSRPTLRKHFAAELQYGRAKRRAEVIGLLFRSARSGNVSAIKRLEEMSRTTGASDAHELRAEQAHKAKKSKDRQDPLQRGGSSTGVHNV